MSGKKIIIVVSVLLLMLGVGCAGNRESNNGYAIIIVSEENKDGGKEEIIGDKPVNGLKITIKSDKSEYQEGEDILIDFTFKNISDTPITILERMYCGRFRWHTLVFIGNDKKSEFQDRCYVCRKDSPIYKIINPGKKYTIQFNPTGKRSVSWSLALKLKPGVYQVKSIYDCFEDFFF